MPIGCTKIVKFENRAKYSFLQKWVSLLMIRITLIAYSKIICEKNLENGNKDVYITRPNHENSLPNVRCL